jgi:hypothetical protein
VIVNEFGVIACDANPKARGRYIGDLRRALEAHGLAWNHWEYNHWMGIYPKAQDCGLTPAPRGIAPDARMLRALLG